MHRFFKHLLLLILVAVLLAGVAAALLLPFLIEDANFELTFNAESLQPSVAILLILSALLMGGVAVGLVVVFYLVLWRGQALVSADGPSRALALALVVLAFPGTMVRFLLHPLDQGGIFVANVPSLLRSQWQGVLQADAGVPFPLGQIAQRTMDTWGGALMALAELPVELLPPLEVIRPLAVAVVAWVGLSLLLVHVRRSEVPPWLQRLQAVTPSTRENVLLVGLFLAGSYLSVAAIAAIPWLQESATLESSRAERLEEQLGSVTMTPEELERDLPDMLLTDTLRTGTDPLTELEERLDTLAAGVSEWTDGPGERQRVGRAWEEQVATVRMQLRALRDERNRLSGDWISSRTAFMREQEELTERARSNLRRHMAVPMAAQERATYTSLNEEWLRGNLQGMRIHLDQLRASLERFDRAVGTWAQYLSDQAGITASEIQSWAADTTGTIASPFVYLGAEPSYVFREASMIRSLGEWYADPPPAVPTPGSDWGPFQWVASWLLNTRSAPLAMITGMLGFGLLGASVSSLVRETGTPDDVVQAARRPGAVVIRGFAAAIVIFLSVEGGLDLFAQGAQDPNPYVLFFACLVGAVFSGDVWRAARRRLQDRLGGGGGG